MGNDDDDDQQTALRQRRRLVDEETALLSLVQGSEGKAWASSITIQGWKANSGVPVCDWEGVTCRVDMDLKHSVVAEVSLPAKGLSGTIPTELGLLSELEHLVLRDNILMGSIPQEIANLKKLVTLDLTECFLTGALPQRFESSELTTLNLANNAISGRFFQTDDSPHLASIVEIRMENNLLTGTLHGPTLTRMPRLETLSLSENDLSGLIPGSEIGALLSLQYLYLDSNHFVGPLPSQLAQVGKAQILELWVQDNALSGTVPASYARFDRMHDFFIDGNKLTGALPPDLCGPEINSDFFENVPPEAERNYCDSIACPAGSVAFEGVYPCEQCPGGEAARLKNRYLGQTGKCDDYSERDIMKIFHDATTKGGAWSGVSDWDDENQPVCQMTGVTCDAHGNVVEIMLKNRNLEGHIPDQIGFLSFLETLDVSDNNLMGYVPSDLQWTSISRLDISGNKIRGLVPPNLCMMEELNGNGKDSVFYCDRIACPEGTYNSFGFHHGVDGEKCVPCYDDHPFIARKSCERTKRPSDSPHFFKAAEAKAGEDLGTFLGVLVMVLCLVAAVIFALVLLVRRAKDPRKKYLPGDADEGNDDAVRRDEVYDYNDEEEDEDAANYSFSEPDHSRYGKNNNEIAVAYRDFVISDDHADEERAAMAADRARDRNVYVDNDDDDASRASHRSNRSMASRRSAAELMDEHRGVALNRRERLKKAMSERVPSDLGRRAREAASSVNVSARRIAARRQSAEAAGTPRGGRSKHYMGEDGEGYEDEIKFRRDVELVRNISSTSSQRGQPSRNNNDSGNNRMPSDMLDVPMIT